MTLKGLLRLLVLFFAPNYLSLIFIATPAQAQDQASIDEYADRMRAARQQQQPQQSQQSQDATDDSYDDSNPIDETGTGKGKLPDLTNIVAGIDLPEGLAGDVRKMLQKKGVHYFLRYRGCQSNVTIVCFSLGQVLEGPSGTSYYGDSSYNGNGRRSGYGSFYGSASGTLLRPGVVIELVYPNGRTEPLATGSAIAQTGQNYGSSFLQGSCLGRRGNYSGYSNYVGGSSYVSPEMAQYAGAHKAFAKLLGSKWEKLSWTTHADWEANAQSKISAAFHR